MIPWNHMLLNSEWHVHLTYFSEKSDKKMMDSNLKKSYEHWKKKATMPQTTALKQNLISGASCNHQTYSKGEVFFLIMIILFHMYMLIFRDL